LSTREGRWETLEQWLQEHQCGWTRNLAQDDPQWGIHLLDDPPHNRLLGPVFARGGPSAVVMQGGREIFACGEPDRADMTFSVTKTYLGLLAGIAFDDGLLGDPTVPVCKQLPGIGFDDDHNCQITWQHLLQFTSEWSGRCFGVPEQVDRYRVVGFQTRGETGRKGDPRPLRQPGSYWEYNDVRINQFALALAHLLGRALPEVFNERIAQPLGTSGTHQWYGYDNSWVEIAGRQVQSVPGGGHWGGGMRISARDQALIGKMMLAHGKVENGQIISSEWITAMLTPCEIAPFYGYFTWLNTAKRAMPAATEQSYFGLGVGGQLIWHAPELDVVAVFRWIDSTVSNELIELTCELLD
jgi:CubicO group peptidase (beta-lactamase class C family)